uniref:ribosomal protein L24 n=1 Tax=Porphyridium aerugineum TaxID=2792 RepID=UPI001FCCCF7E|nr:ribosomal protein L24 [Porphyridium aerugineum]UNJ17880.1 ribosomal protein L24 [Porphyridium aerugineum]
MSKINSMHVKLRDNVQVISGKDKGKIGEVTKILRKKHQVIIKGVNLKIKHVKPTRENQSGQITQIEFPIDSSNVMLYSMKENVKSRFEYIINQETNKKMRRLKKTNEFLS